MFRYRSAGREVIDVLKKNCSIVERASVDEAYLDITQIVDEKFSKGMFTPEDILMELNNSYIVEYSDSGVNDEGIKYILYCGNKIKTTLFIYEHNFYRR